MILACDPGIHGAFAWTDGRQLFVRDMPTYPAIVNGRKRPVIDEGGLFWLMEKASHRAKVLVIERVGGIPAQSAPGAFTFGYGTGLVCGMARGMGFRIEKAEPSRWKAVMKCPADKDLARARASEVWPANASDWLLKKNDGRAEAALLARYGYDVFGELEHYHGSPYD